MSAPRCQWGALVPDTPVCAAGAAATFRVDYRSRPGRTVQVDLCRAHADWVARRLLRAVTLTDPEGDAR
jgi:hypothetical protein